MKFATEEAYQRELTAHRRINAKISPLLARQSVISQFPQNTAEKYEKACSQKTNQSYQNLIKALKI